MGLRNFQSELLINRVKTVKLYRNYVERVDIAKYHCHLLPKEHWLAHGLCLLLSFLNLIQISSSLQYPLQGHSPLALKKNACKTDLLVLGSFFVVTPLSVQYENNKRITSF